MENQNKKISNFIIVIILILFVALCYSFFSKQINNKSEIGPSTKVVPSQKVETVTDEHTSSASSTVSVMNEKDTISLLMSSWKETQKNFSIKAGESGTFNHPDKIQFIAPTVMIVHYDDGLVDHTSVIVFENNIFREFKNVGVLSTLPLASWKTLLETYGSPNYAIGNYKNSEGDDYVKVENNIFVK